MLRTKLLNSMNGMSRNQANKHIDYLYNHLMITKKEAIEMRAFAYKNLSNPKSGSPKKRYNKVKAKKANRAIKKHENRIANKVINRSGRDGISIIFYHNINFK